jgi:hypothetical protein
MKGTWRARLGKHLAAQSRRDEVERIMHRAEPVAETLDDYFVMVKRRGGRPPSRTRWTWEIRRRSKPLGVECNGDIFVTPQAAKLAGEKALNELLHHLLSPT